MDKKFISFGEYNYLVSKLAKKISESGRTYNKIYAIIRGGLPVATSLSHLLGIRKIITSDLLDYTSINELLDKNTLVADDITDSGDTLGMYEGYDTACLICKEGAKEPVYYARKEPHNVWIVFPWERRDEPQMRDADINY